MALTVSFNSEDMAGIGCDVGWTEGIVSVKNETRDICREFSLYHALAQAAASNADGSALYSTFTTISPAARS